MLSEAQGRFVQALRDSALPPPDGVSGRGGERPDRRFAVYRNNVFVSLVEALATAYPVTARLVGENFFRAMARDYAGGNLPRTPVMIDYGESFPAHVDAFEPARGLAYLGDVARLEWAHSRAYHAAEAEPLRLAALRDVPPEHLSDLRLELHPSLRLVRSRWPVLEIWRTNSFDEIVRPVDMTSGGGDVLALRPHASVELRPLQPSGSAFLAALSEGGTLGMAYEAAIAADAAFDLTSALAGLFEMGAVVALRPDTADREEG